MNNIVITGMAVWDTLGHDAQSNFQKILDTRSSTPTRSTLREYLGFPLADPPEMSAFQEQHFSKNKCPRFTQISMWVAEQAIAQSGLAPDRSRIAGIASTLFNDPESILHTANRFIGGSTRAGPSDLFFTTNDSLIITLSRIYDIRGMTWAMAASCSSAIYAIEIASAMIRQDLLDQAIILAADLCTEPYNAFRVYGTNPYSRSNQSRPFDSQRDGIVMSDGMAAVVIESRQSAERRGARSLATILGTGTATQCGHRTNPRHTQDSYHDAFNKAVASAGISAKDIGWISAHATGTPDGDEIENEIMSQLVPGVPITSLKGHIGHTMGASSLVEIVYTVLAQQQAMIPGIANTQEVTMPSTLDFVLETRNSDGRPVIKNSYGFAGRAASIILQV